jgi:hypothetical protein
MEVNDMKRKLLAISITALLVNMTFCIITGTADKESLFYINFDKGVVSDITDIVDENYKFLIISPESFSNELQPLKEHKEYHSITTKIITLEDIFNGIFFPVNGRDNAEKIKYFIKDAMENWSISYVMLVGGKEVLPVRYTLECYWGVQYPYISDLYYADIYDSSGHFCSWDSNQDDVFSGKSMNGVEDEVDLYPDISLGRLLCENQEEVQIVVGKIINYENNAYNKEWFHNLILCGGDDARMRFKEKYFPSYFNIEGGIVWEGEYIGDRIAEYLSGFTAKKIYATGLFKPSIKFLSVDNINEAINDGAGFLLFVGHGSPTMAINTNFPLCKNIWLPYPSGYYNSHSIGLHNGDELPVTVFAGCNCGNFNYTDIPIAWDFVKKENGGSIASFAATTGSIVLFSTLCTETFTGYLAMDVFRLYSEGIDILGDIWSHTITRYLDDENAMSFGDIFSELNWRNKLANNYVLEEWALIGDPTLKIGGYP